MVMKRAIVEVHDVSPYYSGEFLRILSLLNTLNIEKFSLLLVPNFWNAYPLNSDLVLLKVLKGTLGEVILHGYTHQGKRFPWEWLWTDGEGEFSRLSKEETEKRIREGQELLKAFGLESEFFVPPAWFGNPFLEKVLQERGFKGIGYRGGIKFFPKRGFLFAPVLTLSNRKVLSGMSVKLFSFGEKVLERFSLIRLAIHCADFRDREKVSLWEGALRKIRAKRRLITYGELFSAS